MSSKYGFEFETPEDKQKREHEELQKEYKRRHQRYEEAVNTANKVSFIVLDILEDFVKAKAWTEEVSRGEPRMWLVGPPPDDLTNWKEIKRRNPLHIFAEPDHLEVYCNWSYGDYDGVVRLCQVLRDKTRMTIELFYPPESTFTSTLTPKEVFR